MALASEVIGAVLTPGGVSEGRWVHHVPGFEQAVLHAARGHWARAAANGRHAAANLPWVQRERVRKSAKSKVLRAVNRLKGLTGLLSVRKAQLGRLASLAALPHVASSAGQEAAPRAGAKGRGGPEDLRAVRALARKRDRAAVWAAAEEKRADELARDLLSWKGKVALQGWRRMHHLASRATPTSLCLAPSLLQRVLVLSKRAEARDGTGGARKLLDAAHPLQLCNSVAALLLALAAGMGTMQRGREEDGGARDLLAAALCAIFGAQLSAAGVQRPPPCAPLTC